MKIDKIVITALAALALPTLSFAQSPPDTASPTGTADSGAQKVRTPEDPNHQNDSDKTSQDPAPNGGAANAGVYSPTSNANGGAVNPSVPTDNTSQESAAH